MKIVFDLDGVLRDLNGYLMHLHGGEYPTKWDWKYAGKSIFDCVEENLAILSEAPPTAYLRVLKKHFEHPEIWTSQPEKWRVRTLGWISEHISDECEVRFLTTAKKEARLKEEKDTLLVEDSPNFTNYDRILLIERPYNQDVKDAMRIFGGRHLNNMLQITKGIE